MKESRRDFIKLTSLACLGLTGTDLIYAAAQYRTSRQKQNNVFVGKAIARLEDGNFMTTPFWRVDSGKDGPSLLLLAAQHGNEVQGAEVARRFQEICTTSLVAGSVWLLPMANMLAVQNRRHSFGLGPEQNNRLSDKINNMQQTWPGNPDGNDTERLAYSLDQEVLRHCSHVVDMHCWEHVKAAETLTENDHEPSRAMGAVTTTRFISYRSGSIPKGDKMMIRELMRKRGGSVLVMELSGQFQIQEKQVMTGLSSMINIARLLQMMEGEPELIEGPRVIHSPEASNQVIAPCTGLFIPGILENSPATLNPGDYVEKGNILGNIIRQSDLTSVPVKAPVSGYLWQYGLCHWNLCDASLPALHPYTEEGETIAIIVTV